MIGKYNDLELSILSCILQKPELMKDVFIEDKHFKKHRRLWQFMNKFYGLYKTFDITLMFAVCSNKNQLIEYILAIADTEPCLSQFKNYQKQLIKLYKETEKESWIINKIYDLNTDLYIRKIETKDFKKEVDKIYKMADKIFGR